MGTTRHAIDALLRSCGLAARRVVPVARLSCEIHRIALVRGGDVALRIYPADRVDARPIETEIAWPRALAEEGVAVPRSWTTGRATTIGRGGRNSSRAARTRSWPMEARRRHT
jgi:hypothetical protein